MSADVVIRAEGLGKRYVIGHQARERVPTFRDAIVRNVKEFARTTGDILKGKPLISGDEIEEFWALKDVSFEIRRGDVVGVIGRNGAGKSTLLKVLSRITEPSAGRVEIKGRVASLLEVGTGFHPELTGRENIYLNGAILGMSRIEIRRKFDEIVAFAEVEKFLDTPVKRYSSGMYVRLAFAVAAHLEPEILIVDEVLAVGDAEFQKKCLGKMQDVAGHGRTVLFVSHNMGAVRDLCSIGIVLVGGKLKFNGVAENAIEMYGKPAIGAKVIPKSNALTIYAARADLTSNISPQIELHLSISAPTALSVEFRAFIRDANSSPIGIASVGGFGAAAVHLPKGITEAFFAISASDIAQGPYLIEAELVDSNGAIARAPELIPLTVARSPKSGENVALRSEWGLGCIRFDASLSMRQPADAEVMGAAFR